jgi:uncharacterized protein
MISIAQRIADELSVKTQQVDAAIGLLDDGATVPFISRYRKEVTGGLDDTQMRTLEERLRYLRELEERRESILNSIREQEKLTPALEQEILEADSKTRLEDLYLPYKQKRRTKGQIAIEAGLEPLAEALYANPSLKPDTEAEKYLNPDHKIATSKDALDGAKFILMERFAENADLLADLRHLLMDEAVVTAKVNKNKETEGAKFRDYFDYQELWNKIPSHRALALFRGRNEGILAVNVDLPVKEEPSQIKTSHPAELRIAKHVQWQHCNRAADDWLADVVRWTWKVKLQLHLETDLLGQLREKAEAAAIQVFADNVKDLLLAPPAGAKVTMGLDPGLRTGVKVAIVDATGKVLDHGAIFPNPPQNKIQAAEAQVVHWCRTHKVNLIAIGNGTASRETDSFVAEIIKHHPDLQLQKVMVNEAGASVYSASELAAKEFPDLDVTIRGAVSIARRLQDPLAELVKIDPKSIGVGQYQHDLSPTKLTRSLDSVVEDCVNGVGVDVNTASVPLLARVSGLNSNIASNVVAFRDQHGAFKSRDQLKSVPRFGDKTFEQAAGFLRVTNGDNPLDASAVHPESYRVVEDIAKRHQRDIDKVIGDQAFVKSLNPQDFVTEQFGLPTITDILKELDKPGRDPRGDFKTAAFKAGVEKLSDLSPGLVLEGTVTNVTNFGAFVDIGVHQDGLVHISALANTFVKDPRDVVKTGDIVRVKVVEVDEVRKRIALTMRLDEAAAKAKPSAEPPPGKKPKSKLEQQGPRKAPAPKTGSLGDLLQQALNKK